ncbi:MAG: hypothetical protein ACRDTG_12545 [Pseudonocardiaceae bacterium]
MIPLRLHPDAELPRTGPERRPVIERDIEELTRQIEAQQHLIAHPMGTEQQTTQRIAAGLERERRPERPVSAACERRLRLLAGRRSPSVKVRL